jgi:transposase
MDVVIARCCGLDVHQATITACLLLDGERRPKKVVRTFRTMRSELEEFRDWLKSFEVTHVAFEGTRRPR